jgi:tetratricopeptide (TPR) repeat protein
VTKCRFHINAAPDYLLTSSEITLINQLTIVYYREGENDKAIDLMQALVLNFDTVCADEQYRARKYPTLVFNLTKYLYDQGRYAEAIALCDKAIDVCLEVFYLYMLPKLIISKACCLHELGKHNESKMLAIQAYHLFDAYKLHDSKESAKVKKKEKFNVYL